MTSLEGIQLGAVKKVVSDIGREIVQKRRESLTQNNYDHATNQTSKAVRYECKLGQQTHHGLSIQARPQ